MFPSKKSNKHPCNFNKLFFQLKHSLIGLKTQSSKKKKIFSNLNIHFQQTNYKKTHQQNSSSQMKFININNIFFLLLEYGQPTIFFFLFNFSITFSFLSKI